MDASARRESSLAHWLRTVPSLTGTAPEPVTALPETPEPLFEDWIRYAVAQGVGEPHAATLATVDADGLSDARTLILKDLDERGWAFAGRRSSAKGEQLAQRPAAALNFWWPSLVRAVRVRGPVAEAPVEESAADFAARPTSGNQSDSDWALWRIQPVRVEFWQGAQDRNHLRWVYERAGVGSPWSHRGP